jgi:glycerol-3-phosphate dehydrogenase
VEGRSLVNAAGPWVSETLSLTGINSAHGIVLVKGSHIVVPRLYQGDHAYFLQLPDQRIIFVAPWHNETTMIGTTDVRVDSPGDAGIDAAEIEYLCSAVNLYFSRTIGPDDVVSTWSGIRPLYDDGASAAQEVTRDYVLEMDRAGPPLLSVFGGKITTARHLAEEALEKLASANGWAVSHATRNAPLPGGEMESFERFLEEVQRRHPILGAARARRMARAYGTRLSQMLEGRESLGEHFGDQLTAVEVDWLVDREWARTADDILWRRTKLGLHIEDRDRERLAAYLERNAA